jgi:hypothetical protein
MCHFSRLGEPAVPISTLESGSDIWPKGHLRLLSLDLKFEEQEIEASFITWYVLA